MNYNFVEIGPSVVNNQSVYGTSGIEISPIQELLDGVPEKQNVLKIAKAVAWKSGQTNTDVFYIPLQAIENAGIPAWFEEIISYETLNVHQNWALTTPAGTAIQKRTVATTTLQQVFTENNVEQLDKLFVWVHEKSPEILLFNATFLGGLQNKVKTITFKKDAADPLKIQQAIDTYTGFGYTVKESEEHNVVLEYTAS